MRCHVHRVRADIFAKTVENEGQNVGEVSLSDDLKKKTTHIPVLRHSDQATYSSHYSAHFGLEFN